jgi:tRNA (cytidine/uridine-2'-O-)-methyltransferase
VKPFGFEIDDKRLKRAGLDYWQHLEVIYYDHLDDFLSKNGDSKMVFLSSHGVKAHWDIKYTADLFLVFGKESVGLPKSLIEKQKSQLFKIPMYSEDIRSLNLANAVGIVIYEGLRQLNL